MEYRLTTVAACRVARIDRQRFNEYVSVGDFGCAPTTVSGRTRLFEEADLITLFIFAREIEKGLKPLIAGFIACAVGDEVRRHPDHNKVSICRFVNSPHYRVVPNDTDAAGLWLSGNPVFDVRAYNIAYVRDLIRLGVEEERSIVGPSDE